MKLTIITTGGTIEKTYDETDGSLRNVKSILDEILITLRLPDLSVSHHAVMSKDSLEMNEEDREAILRAVREWVPASDAVVILHGTDTLEQTGEHLHRKFPDVGVPVVLTGAMRPYEFRDTDAMQNLTEALLAARLVKPGYYVAMHNRVLRFPGVYKDRTRLHFRHRDEGA